MVSARVSVPEINDEPTWRCQQNPFVGALGIQSAGTQEITAAGIDNRFAIQQMRVNRILANHSLSSTASQGSTICLKDVTASKPKGLILGK